MNATVKKTLLSSLSQKSPFDYASKDCDCEFVYSGINLSVANFQYLKNLCDLKEEANQTLQGVVLAHSQSRNVDLATESSFFQRALLKIRVNHTPKKMQNFTCYKLDNKFNSKKELYEYAFY